ncbi:hypothetical protein evm_010736 [Chilo suppressalis]|nr:hypothetical protein evm_010736 [Chilo suppressalis]
MLAETDSARFLRPRLGVRSPKRDNPPAYAGPSPVRMRSGDIVPCPPSLFDSDIHRNNHVRTAQKPTKYGSARGDEFASRRGVPQVEAASPLAQPRSEAAARPEAASSGYAALQCLGEIKYLSRVRAECPIKR